MSKNKPKKDDEQQNPDNAFLHESIGVAVSNEDADDFELLIGSLNDVLEKMYSCRICYDKSEEPSEHWLKNDIVIPEGKTLFDGFAIFVHEEEIEKDD